MVLEAKLNIWWRGKMLVTSKLSCTMTPRLPCGLSNSKSLQEEIEGEREGGVRECEKERERIKDSFLTQIQHIVSSC